MIGLPMPRTQLPLVLDVSDRIIRPRISKVTIPITYDCNQKCKTCGIWTTYRQDPGKRKLEITPFEFSRFCSNNDLLWIAFTGGEPFLRDDMGIILGTAMKYCKLVSLTSNGYSPSRIFSGVTKALLMSEKSTLAINISMNGSQKMHDEIANTPGSFERAKESLIALRDIKDSRLKVGISYTSSKFNKWEFNTYLKAMEDIGIGLDNITFGMGQDSPSYYQGKVMKDTVFPGTTYIEDFAREIACKMDGHLDPFIFISKKYLRGYYKYQGKYPKCVAGQYSLMLDPFWNVYPCMFYCPSKPCGNLRDVDFSLSKLDLKSCQSIVKTCTGCWTPCESYSTIVFRPWRCF